MAVSMEDRAPVVRKHVRQYRWRMCPSQAMAIKVQSGQHGRCDSQRVEGTEEVGAEAGRGHFCHEGTVVLAAVNDAARRFAVAFGHH
jgi:hypothetical protein